MTNNATSTLLDRDPNTEPLWNCLNTVIDPEAGINVMELGLIYKITRTENHVHILMTMTSPACPMGDLLLSDIETAVRKVVPATTKIDVELTFNPLWEPSMMTEAAREHFGW